ncbi:tail fiber domain-containing protein [Candidatus Woesearchaeota archaeon]|nr:tail fiber domain-containing protein [Candidatus Woesearchaeota archaeon]
MITIADSGTTWANYDGIRIYNTDTTTNAGGRLVFNLGDSGTAQAGIAGVIVASSDSALAFITEDSDTITEKMRITETGNVGIGTTDPADLLVVQNSNKANISLAPSGNNAIIRMDYITGNDAIIMFRENSIEKGRIAYVGDTKELRLISSEAESILTLHSNNTERIRINAAGNVGIGTTSPGALLEIVDGDVNITNGTGDWGMIFDEATGFVGMGYSINDNWAQLNGPLSIFASGDNGSSAIRIQTNDATGEHSGIGFYTASLPGQSFPLGLVGLEKTSDTGQHSGDLVFYTRPGTTNVAPIERMRITSGGDICDPATDADLSDCASDARLKTNIQDYQYGLNEILQLRPVNFNWNQKAVSELSYNPNLTNTGLIAQEVEQIIPEWVETKEDGYKKIPGSGDLDLVLVNAVKELNSKISALEQQNNELKAEISALKEPSLEKNPREKKK